MTEKRASTQDIRPLKIAIVNLMPTKEVTETQLLRLLGNTPLQIEISLVRMENHQSKNTDDSYLDKFYIPSSEVFKHKFDGMIITGAPVEQLPFEEKFMEEIANAINESIEKLVWQGDSSHTNEPDGFLKILEAVGSGVVSATWSAGTTAYNKIKAVYNKIPANIIDKEDTVIFVGEETYREFIQDLVAANLYHFSPDYKAGEYMVPGTSIRVIAVNGLNSTGKIVAGRLSNFFYGVGAEDDKDTFDFWYSQDNREFRLAVYFAMAVQVAYPNEIVLGKQA